MRLQLACCTCCLDQFFIPRSALAEHKLLLGCSHVSNILVLDLLHHVLYTLFSLLIRVRFHVFRLFWKVVHSLCWSIRIANRQNALAFGMVFKLLILRQWRLLLGINIFNFGQNHILWIWNVWIPHTLIDIVLKQMELVYTLLTQILLLLFHFILWIQHHFTQVDFLLVVFRLLLSNLILLGVEILNNTFRTLI